jgi:hypothetical protein
MATEEKDNKICHACQEKMDLEKAKEAEKARKQLEAKIVSELTKAEECIHFYHHTLYKRNGEPEDPLLVGKRTCDLSVKKECGHTEPKYTYCMAWTEGKSCLDWQAH